MYFAINVKVATCFTHERNGVQYMKRHDKNCEAIWHSNKLDRVISCRCRKKIVFHVHETHPLLKYCTKYYVDCNRVKKNVKGYLQKVINIGYEHQLKCWERRCREVLLKNNSPVIPPSPTHNIEIEKLPETDLRNLPEIEEVDEGCVFEDNTVVDNLSSSKDASYNIKASSKPSPPNKSNKSSSKPKEIASKDSSSRNQTNWPRKKLSNTRNNTQQMRRGNNQQHQRHTGNVDYHQNSHHWGTRDQSFGQQRDNNWHWQNNDRPNVYGPNIGNNRPDFYGSNWNNQHHSFPRWPEAFQHPHPPSFSNWGSQPPHFSHGNDQFHPRGENHCPGYNHRDNFQNYENSSGYNRSNTPSKEVVTKIDKEKHSSVKTKKDCTSSTSKSCKSKDTTGSKELRVDPSKTVPSMVNKVVFSPSSTNNDISMVSINDSVTNNVALNKENVSIKPKIPPKDKVLKFQLNDEDVEFQWVEEIFVFSGKEYVKRNEILIELNPENCRTDSNDNKFFLVSCKNHKKNVNVGATSSKRKFSESLEDGNISSTASKRTKKKKKSRKLRGNKQPLGKASSFGGKQGTFPSRRSQLLFKALQKNNLISDKWRNSIYVYDRAFPNVPFQFDYLRVGAKEGLEKDNLNMYTLDDVHWLCSNTVKRFVFSSEMMLDIRSGVVNHYDIFSDTEREDIAQNIAHKEKLESEKNNWKEAHE